MSRMWEFDEGDQNTVFMTFPATDEPMEQWYQNYSVMGIMLML